jgi:hypothetical protein
MCSFTVFLHVGDLIATGFGLGHMPSFQGSEGWDPLLQPDQMNPQILEAECGLNVIPVQAGMTVGSVAGVPPARE